MERSINYLIDNIVERLRVSSIKGSLDNRRYKGYPHNVNFDDLPFDGDGRLIARRQLYLIDDNIVFS